MSWQEERLNEFFNSRAFMWIVAAVVLLATCAAMLTGRVPAPQQGQGVFFHWGGLLIQEPQTSWEINMLCLGGVAALLMTLNRRYNFVRTVTTVPASMFLLLQLASPQLSVNFGVGTAMCVVLAVALFTVFAAYQKRGRSQRSIFLVMATVSLCSMFHFAFLFLIPVMLLGFVYVRAMSLKGFVAMLLGLVTPFWIALGTGLVSPWDYHLPQLSSIWNVRDLAHLPVDIAIAVVTAVVTIAVTVVNLMTLLNYRLQTRVYNAFLVVVSALAIVMMGVDFNNIVNYLPILNLCLAIQLAHLHTIGTATRRYLVLVAIVVASLVSFTLQMML